MIFMIDGKADGISIRVIAVLPGGLGCILYNLSVENFENFCCEEVHGKHIMVSIGFGALRHHCAALLERLESNSYATTCPRDTSAIYLSILKWPCCSIAWLVATEYA